MKRGAMNIIALGCGLFIGALGTLVHNITLGWFPLGLLIAIVGSGAASKVIGVRFGRRGVRFWFFVGWMLIVLRAAIFGNSDELLIMANSTGNAFLGLGFLVVLLTIWSRI